MTFLALLILGILWAVVLLPPLIQRLPELTSRPTRATVGGFAQDLSRLERPAGSPIATNAASNGVNAGREPLLPPSAAAAARRRRDVLGSLVAIALFFLVATSMFGRPALYAHLGVDVLIVVFGTLMLRRGRFQAQRDEIVTPLPQRNVGVAPIDESVELEYFRKTS